MAIVVNHLKEIQDILHFLNDKTQKSFGLKALNIYLDTGSTGLDGLSFQSDFAATRPEAAPVLYDPGILELKDIIQHCLYGASFSICQSIFISR